MKFFKTDQKLKVCFTIQELACLVLSKNLPEIIDIARNSGALKNSKILTNNLAQKSANSKEHELYVALFDLYELFKNECQFCFNLKDTFNLKLNAINTFNDLEKFNNDPPDVIVYHQNNFYEFELKRYRGELSAKSLFDFIIKKIITHYSDHNCNYYIILQPRPYSALNLDIFENLHKKIIQLKRNLGKIAFSVNNDNKEMILINVFPELAINKRPFIQGSKYIDKVLRS